MNEMNVDNGGGRQERVPVNYPANSRKKKDLPDKPKVEKVVEGTVIRRKKGLFGRMRETFLSEESGSVPHYIVMEVLIPAAKNAVSDAISQGIERALFGEVRARPSGGSRPAHTSYDRRFREPVYSDRREMSRQARAMHDFNDIILNNRGDAEEVIDRLRDLVNQYGQASVADLYDMVGVTGEFTDDRWGWFDLRVAGVRAIRGGYLLDLPRPMQLN